MMSEPCCYFQAYITFFSVMITVKKNQNNPKQIDRQKRQITGQQQKRWKIHTG